MNSSLLFVCPSFLPRQHIQPRVFLSFQLCSCPEHGVAGVCFTDKELLLIYVGYSPTSTALILLLCCA